MRRKWKKSPFVASTLRRNGKKIFVLFRAGYILRHVLASIERQRLADLPSIYIILQVERKIVFFFPSFSLSFHAFVQPVSIPSPRVVAILLPTFIATRREKDVFLGRA